MATKFITPATVEVLEQHYDDVRSDYSGRGMYGASCFGIVSDGSGWNLVQSLMELRADAEDEDLAEDLQTLLDSEPSTDSMGYDTIYYWRNIGVEGYAI